MPKPRSIKSTLFQLLNEALCPAYILDCEGCIVFANAALCGWLKVDFSQIEMAQCIPTTDALAAEPDNTIRGLAIPESTYSRAFSAGYVFRTAADKHLIWRKANFTRLTGSDVLSGNILVTLETEDSNLDTNPVVNETWSRQLISQMRTSQSQILGLDRFVGISPEAVKLNEQIQVACQSDANVLIFGAPGSGKGQIAAIIHNAREPRDSPTEITPINCRVADAQTIQNTIVQTRRERGDGVAWFQLNHPESLQPEALNELMGFLQLPRHGMKFISVSEQPNHIDSRIAQFIDTLTVHVPALAERKEDIPLVADFLLKQKTENPLIEFDAAAKQTLVDYDWPNNLDELENTIKAINPASDCETVTPADLPDRFQHAIQAQQISGSDVPEIQLDAYLASIEAELIGRAMKVANNNKAKACKLLGISRAKLGRRIQQLGLDETYEPVVFEESPEDE